MRVYALVYQCGLANVFRVTLPEAEGAGPHYQRLVQHAYSVAEWYCRGLMECGARVDVYHSDVTGDVLLCPMGPWQEGPGDLWRDKKNPPEA